MSRLQQIPALQAHQIVRCKGEGICILGALILAIMIWAVPAYSLTTAVFPLLDLSRGSNGVNFPLTDYLIKEIKDRGAVVVSRQAVISFMARHRIRSLGMLTTYQIARAKDELGVDLIVLGTVCQIRDRRPASLGLTLELIRTSDAQTIWTSTGDLSALDIHIPLGIAEPVDVKDLFGDLFKRLLASWPTNIGAYATWQHMIDVETVVLRPKYVRPGETVRCSLKLHWAGEVEGLPRAYLKAGERICPFNISEGQSYFTVSWPAQKADGRYPVALVLHLPSGRQETALLGSYYVDSKPPDFTMDLIGHHIDGLPAFSRELTIVPRLIEPEPVSRWQLSFLNASRQIVLRHDGTGQLPRRLRWYGYQEDGSKAPDGKYTVVLKAWDRAGNVSVVKRYVLVRHAPPNVTLNVEERKGILRIDLGNKGEVPTGFWWVKILSEDGRLVKEAEGSNLPATIDIPLKGNKTKNPRLECLLMVKDILGNRTKKHIGNLLGLLPRNKSNNEENEEGSAWIEEF